MPDNSIILNTIKLIASQLLPNCKVMLFGSRARHQEHPYSDYDLLLIIPQSINIQEKMQYKAMIRKALVKQEIVADVLIESEDEIKVKSTLLGHIIRTAVREGVYL